MHPKVLTFISTTEGLSLCHRRSDARLCFLKVQWRTTARIKPTTLVGVLRAKSSNYCMKLDIEGAEPEMLQQALFPKWIECFVLEYSFSAEASIIGFRTA